MTSSSEINVVSFLKQVAEKRPDRLALVLNEDTKTEQITYRNLWERADRISEGLKQRGFQPGQRVILMIPMSINLYAVLLGIQKMGGVAVFVDPWIKKKQIAAFSAFAEPSAFIGIGKSHILRLLDGRLRRIPLTVTTGRKILGFTCRSYTW